MRMNLEVCPATTPGYQSSSGDGGGDLHQMIEGSGGQCGGQLKPG